MHYVGEQECRESYLSISKNSKTQVSQWLLYGNAYERLLGANKPDFIVGSTIGRRGIHIVVAWNSG